MCDASEAASSKEDLGHAEEPYKSINIDSRHGTDAVWKLQAALERFPLVRSGSTEVFIAKVS